MAFLPPNVDPQSGENPLFAALSPQTLQRVPQAAPQPAQAAPSSAPSGGGGGGGGLLSGLFGGGSVNPMGNPIGNALMGHGNFLVPLLAGLLGGKTPEQQRLAAAQAQAARTGDAISQGFEGLDTALQIAKGNHNRAIHAWLGTPAGQNFFANGGKMSEIKTYLDAADTKPIAGAPGTIYRNPNDMSIIAQNPPAPPTIMKEENSFDTTIGQQLAKEYITGQQEGMKGVEQKTTFRSMLNELHDPNFYSGFGGQTAMAFKRAAVALGVADPDSVSSTENFVSLGSQALIKSVGSLGRQISDGDRVIYENMLPNIRNTPYGNALLIDMGLKLADRKEDIAALQQQYAASHGGRLDANWYSYIQRWANDNPIFKEGWEKADIAKGILPDPKTGQFLEQGFSNIDPEAETALQRPEEREAASKLRANMPASGLSVGQSVTIGGHKVTRIE